jgi:hypothetical protein
MKFALRQTQGERFAKAVRGELVEPRTDESPSIYGICRTPFDKPVLSKPFGLRQAQTER